MVQILHSVLDNPLSYLPAPKLPASGIASMHDYQMNGQLDMCRGGGGGGSGVGSGPVGVGGNGSPGSEASFPCRTP